MSQNRKVKQLVKESKRKVNEEEFGRKLIESSVKIRSFEKKREEVWG